MTRATSSIFIAVFLLAGCLLVTSDPPSNKTKVLYVLMDGLRWDYVDSLSIFGGFKTIIGNGVRAEHMVPIFPSESYPNYFALSTGMYAENTGIVCNYMYDEETGKVFNIGEGSESQDSMWFQTAEPIWITSTRNRVNTACFEWPLTNVTFDGVTPKMTTPYQFRATPDTLSTLLHNATDVLASGQIDFCMVYCEWTDYWAHALGPDLMKNVKVPLIIDLIILDFYNYFKSKQLQDKVNIIFVSDHGMTSTDPISTQSLNVENVVNSTQVKFVIDRGAHMGIYPVDGKEDEVYNQLKTMNGVNVFKKNEIPDSYRLKNGKRVPPIFIEALKGNYLLPFTKNKSKQIGGGPVDFQVPGSHGYNPIGYSDMWGTFIASGPAFKSGIMAPAIDNIDVYNLLCHLLGFQALPNNGTWDHVKDMLV